MLGFGVILVSPDRPSRPSDVPLRLQDVILEKEIQNTRGDEYGDEHVEPKRERQ